MNYNKQIIELIERMEKNRDDAYRDLQRAIQVKNDPHYIANLHEEYNQYRGYVNGIYATLNIFRQAGL